MADIQMLRSEMFPILHERKATGMRLSLDRIKTAIANSKTEVVSFDVFDTLIVRPFWEPSDLFLLLNREAARLFDTSVAVDFRPTV